MIYGTNVDYLRKKFYEQSNTFNNLQSIKRETIAKINGDVERLTNLWKKRTLPTNPYVEALKVVAQQQGEFANFDEKIIFLIKCADPSLEALKIYLSYNIKNSKEIEQLANGDPNIKEKLVKERSELVKKYQTELFEKIGINDTRLAFYEQYYKRLFVFKQTKQNPIKKDYSRNFFKDAQSIDNFSINQERFTEIKEKALHFKRLLPETYQSTTTIYKILDSTSELQLKSKEEAYIFFILTCDEALTTLRIFEEEATWSKIEERCLEELSFFYKELPRLEKLYYYQYAPELEISPWLFKKSNN